jgi:hypothetical protein
VTGSGFSLSGTDKSNYTFAAGPFTTTADITKKAITGIFTANNKVYDGNTSAAVSMRDLVGVVGFDAVSLSGGTATFDTKNVGTGKTVTLADASIAGTAVANYSLTSVATTTADITAKSVTVSFQAQDKVFDGNPTATIKASPVPSLVGAVSGDNVSLDSGSGMATFDTSAVGTGKTVTGSSFTKSGGDATNYIFANPQGTTTASISPWDASGKGFYAPVGVANSIFTAAPGVAPVAKPDGPSWNTVKGGQTVPLKFNVFAGGVEKTSLSDIKSFQQSKLTTCINSLDTDLVDLTTTGSTTLRYDTTAMQWIQNWKTPNVTGDSCYRAWVTFADGSTLEAFFKLKK